VVHRLGPRGRKRVSTLESDHVSPTNPRKRSARDTSRVKKWQARPKPPIFTDFERGNTPGEVKGGCKESTKSGVQQLEPLPTATSWSAESKGKVASGKPGTHNEGKEEEALPYA